MRCKKSFEKTMACLENQVVPGAPAPTTSSRLIREFPRAARLIREDRGNVAQRPIPAFVCRHDF